MSRAAMLAVCTVLLLGIGTACSDDEDDAAPPAARQAGDARSGPATGFHGSETLPDLVDLVSPSVVAVVAGGGEGSGVIWSSDGEIVTNYHVIAGADSVEVVLASGERLVATVVASDPLTDLAILRVEHTGLSAATFSDELPRVGSLAIAVGNPLGFESSVTLGIVSGLNRAIPSGGATPALVDLLQTDAAISPGNSGGALINARGEVIGINVAYIPPAQQAVSLGFAIPSVTVVSVVKQLLEDGSVQHAFLGIEPRPLTPQIASQLGLGVSEGVFVFSLTPGGAADSAGMEAGDVIVGMGDDAIETIEDLYAALRGFGPGDTVAVTIVRNDEELELEVTFQSRPAP